MAKFTPKTHFPMARLKCFICDLSFSLSTSLKDHLILHTRDKPFRCDICDKGFKRPHLLKAHIDVHKI